MHDELRAWAESMSGEDESSFEPVPDSALLQRFHTAFAEACGHTAHGVVEIETCPGKVRVTFSSDWITTDWDGTSEGLDEAVAGAGWAFGQESLS